MEGKLNGKLFNGKLHFLCSVSFSASVYFNFVYDQAHFGNYEDIEKYRVEKTVLLKNELNTED